MNKMIASLVAAAFLMTAPAMAAGTSGASPAPKMAKSHAMMKSGSMKSHAMKSKSMKSEMKPAPKASKAPKLQKTARKNHWKKHRKHGHR